MGDVDRRDDRRYGNGGGDYNRKRRYRGMRMHWRAELLLHVHIVRRMLANGEQRMMRQTDHATMIADHRERDTKSRHPSESGSRSYRLLSR